MERPPDCLTIASHQIELQNSGPSVDCLNKPSVVWEMLTSVPQPSGMRMNFTAACALATGMAISLSFCAPYRVEYMEDALRQTTQAELIQKFGYPQRLKRVKSGDQVWEYDFQSKENECVTYVVTFNNEDELREWERHACSQSKRLP